MEKVGRLVLLWGGLASLNLGCTGEHPDILPDTEFPADLLRGLSPPELPPEKSTPSLSPCAPLDHLFALEDPALAQQLATVRPGARVGVSGETSAPLTIANKMILEGRDKNGGCYPPGSQHAVPRVGGITVLESATGTSVSHVEIQRGGIQLHAASRLAFVRVIGPGPGIEAKGSAEMDGIVVSRCDFGMQLDAPSTVTNALITENKGPGVVSHAKIELHASTMDGNGGDGIRLEGEGSKVFNAIVASNGGWGIFEAKRAQILEQIVFFGNREGQYGGSEVNPNHPVISWSEGERIHVTVEQGDRLGTEPALATQVLVRGEYRTRSPYSAVQSPSWTVRYAPGHLALPARAGYAELHHDILGHSRGRNTVPGAFHGERFPKRDSITQWFVHPSGKPDGEGTLEAPSSTLQSVVEKAQPGDVINVFPGEYRERIRVRDSWLRIRGVRVSGDKIVVIEDGDWEGPRPVIDPSGTGVHEQAMLLEDTGYGMEIQGLTIQGALTGLTVIGKNDTVPPEPEIHGMLFRNNAKGLDTDCGGGLLARNRFTDNTVATTFRAGNNWIVEENAFSGPGVAMVFSMLTTHGTRGFEVRNNRFENTTVQIDSLHSRHQSRLAFTGNTLANTQLVVRHGSPSARLEIQNNLWEASSGLRMTAPRGEAPNCDSCFAHAHCSGFCEDGPAKEAERPLPNETVMPHSAPIAISPSGDTVVAVGADFRGVLLLDTTKVGMEAIRHVETGKDPRTVAIRKDGKEALVANLAAGTLSILDLKRGVENVEIPVGIEPYGVIYGPTEKEAFVSLSGANQVVHVSLTEQRILHRYDVGKKPRGLSLDFRKNAWRILVTHFAPRHLENKPVATTGSIQAYLTLLEQGAETEKWTQRELVLPAVSSPHFPPSVPVLMQSVVVRGNRAYLPSFGATPERPKDVILENRKLLQFETTTQALLTVLNLDTETFSDAESANLNAPGRILNGPYGIAFNPASDTEIAIPVYGNNAVARFHLAEGTPPKPVRAYRGSLDLITGTNPRGVVYSADGKRAYTVNFASGTLTMLDLVRNQPIAHVPLGPVTRDRLTPLARKGKELFYTTQRVETAADFWFTCGTCHPDGRTDSVTWEFSNGPRSTPALAASLHSLPLHFDGDRDEFADFEHTVRDLQGGFGLDRRLLEPATGVPIGDNAATGWLAMEAYLLEGIDAPAPHSHPAPLVAQGKAVFESLGCDSCHGGEWNAPESVGGKFKVGKEQFTNTLKDVGTRSVRDRLGEDGFDPPSLWGVAQTAPYLHDGSALTLQDVLKNRKHLLAGVPSNGKLEVPEQQELDALVVYLETLSDRDPSPYE